MMKTIKQILSPLALCALLVLGQSFYATAQNNKALQDFVKQLDQSRGIRIDFELVSDTDPEPATFSYYGQGKSFYIEADFMKAWYNGSSLWTYTPGSGEVNLSTPSPLYIAEVNPLLGITQLSEKEYTINITRENKGYKIAARPLKGSTYEVYCSHLEIFTDQTYKPLSIRMKDKENHYFSIKIRKIERGIKLNPTFFSFTQEKVPTAQIIDLRK